jgi:hypothetical protein
MEMRDSIKRVSEAPREARRQARSFRCVECGCSGPLSTALSIAESNRLQFDPVLGPGFGLRFAASAVGWYRGCLVPLDPHGTLCPRLACPSCRYLVITLPGPASREDGVNAVAWMSPPISRLRETALAGHELDSIVDYRAALEEFTTAARPQTTLGAEMADWARRGLVQEVASVVESRAGMLDELRACVFEEPEAAVLAKHAKAVGLLGLIPRTYPHEIDVLNQALDKWRNYRGIRQRVQAFRMAILDREPVDPWEARRTLAECVRDMRGQVWSENLSRLDRKLMASIAQRLNTGATSPGIDRLAKRYARAPWMQEWTPEISERAETLVQLLKVERMEDHLRAGSIDHLAAELVRWYLDDEVWERAATARHAEHASRRVFVAAERACEILRSRIEILKTRKRELASLSRLASQAESLPDDPKAELALEQQARDSHRAAIAAGAPVEECDTLLRRARAPIERRKAGVRNSITWIVLVLAVIATLYMVLFRTLKP